MKNIFLEITFCLALVISVNAQNDAEVMSNLTLSEAKEIADTYYGSFQQMAKHPDGEIQSQNEGRLLAVLGKDIHGMALATVFRVPNDLVKMMEVPSSDKKTLLITNYIGDFVQIAEENKMDFSYKVLSKDYQESSNVKKGLTARFARVVVQKTIKSAHFPTAQINDTMYINTETKSISLITNEFRKLSDSPLTIEEIREIQERNIQQYVDFQKCIDVICNPSNSEVVKDEYIKLALKMLEGEGEVYTVGGQVHPSVAVHVLSARFGKRGVTFPAKQYLQYLKNNPNTKVKIETVQMAIPVDRIYKVGNHYEAMASFLMYFACKDGDGVVHEDFTVKSRPIVIDCVELDQKKYWHTKLGDIYITEE